MRTFTLDRASDTQAALQAGRTAQYLGGGTTLFDLMKLDVMRPEALVSIAGLGGEARAIEHRGDALWLGAEVRMSEAEEHPLIASEFPVIRDTLWQAASPQLRNMATLGGNVLQRTRCNYFRDTTWAACNKRNPRAGCAAIHGINRELAVLGVSEHCIAHYPGDFAQSLVALGAEVHLVSSEGAERRLPFEELHRLPGDTPHIETNLRPGELITGFTVPRGAWTRRSRYVKVRDRASYAFALASAAVALDMDGDRVRTARIALGGLSAKPWRSHEAEAVLAGQVLDEALAAHAGEIAMRGAVGHGENDFKIELGKRTLTRALLETRAMEVL